MEDDEDNLIERARGIYGFREHSGPEGAVSYWVINAKTGKGKVTRNGTDKPDVTLSISDTDVVDFILG